MIHPPVNVDFYVPDPSVKRDDYYLVVSGLAPNKRVDFAIAACQKLGRRLLIIGTGEEECRLRQQAGTETSFLAGVPMRPSVNIYSVAGRCCFRVMRTLALYQRGGTGKWHGSDCVRGWRGDRDGGAVGESKSDRGYGSRNQAWIRWQ